MRTLREHLEADYQRTRFFSLNPDLYEDSDVFFGESGASEGSTAGRMYDMLGVYAKWWHWTDVQVLSIPIRRRRKMDVVLAYQIQEYNDATKKK